jgi:hypothetical protein
MEKPSCWSNPWPVLHNEEFGAIQNKERLYLWTVRHAHHLPAELMTRPQNSSLCLAPLFVLVGEALANPRLGLKNHLATLCHPNANPGKTVCSASSTFAISVKWLSPNDFSIQTAYRLAIGLCSRSTEAGKSAWTKNGGWS